jgi:ketopantoate hydroxymethyltransferase
MVGDSTFSTHHGRSTTQLRDSADRQWAYGVLIEALAEVSGALRESAQLRGVYLLADLPDGSLESMDRLVYTAERFLGAGAEAVKLEVDGPESLHGIETLASTGVPVFGHLGFTPQTAQMRRHGKTANERQELYRSARAVRDHGACGLVLEMVDPVANAALSAPSPYGIPCFSIFSGPTVPGGGLSVNAWDAMFRHPSGARGFPPTAFLDVADFPEQYTFPNAVRGMTELLGLVAEGSFPESLRPIDTRDQHTPEAPWQPPCP